jgi:hypothetical protein
MVVKRKIPVPAGNGTPVVQPRVLKLNNHFINITKLILPLE